MTQDEFFKKLQDILDTEDDVSAETVLDSLDEWDSLSKMAVAAFLNSTFGVTLSFEDFKAVKTAGDLAAKTGL